MKKYFLTVTNVLMVIFLVCVSAILYMLLTRYPISYLLLGGIFAIIIGIGICFMLVMASYEIK